MADYAIGMASSPEEVAISSGSRNGRQLPPARSILLYDLRRIIAEPLSNSPRSVTGRSGIARIGPRQYAHSHAPVKRIR